MDLVTQIQGIGYSFVYGIVFTFMYHLIYSNLVKIKFKYLRYFLQICCGILFAGIYFTGLFFINEGVFMFLFFQQLLFIWFNYLSKLYAPTNDELSFYYINKAIDYVFFPIRFVFLRFNAIMRSIKEEGEKMSKKRLRKNI